MDGYEVWCHDEIVQMASKKQGTIRQLAESARSPIDFVPRDETVKVPQDFISRNEFNHIDFGIDYEAVRAVEGNRVPLQRDELGEAN
jgi:hypothetical protein